MITKIFEIITKTDKAEKDLENLTSEVDNLNTGLEKTNTEVSDLKSSGKAFATLKKGAKGVAGGFRMMGTALKAAGVGLAIAAFGLLKELFESNQKVVDTFNIAFESLSIAFNDFFNFISKNLGAVSEFFKKIFDDPLASVKALGNAIKDNIIERVKSALEVFGFLGKAMKKLFAGDFKGAIDEVKNAGSEFVDVLTGVDNSVEKATEVISEGVTALTEYTKSTVEAATANVELKKQAELAAAANQGLIEKYDLQAESLRQIRDDERKSIAERKKANDELALVLDKQEKAMLENAQLSLKSAQAELKKDKDNVESKNAVQEAENELAAVRAQVAGFRSEQLTNEAALEREAIELINSKLESENKLAIERKRFDAEQIEDELQKLETLKEIDAEEQEIEAQRLQDVINTTNAGTQAKIDAEIAYNEFLEESRQKNKTRDKEIADEKVKIEKQKYDEFYDAFWENANKVLEEGKRIEQKRADAKEAIQRNSLMAMSNLIEAFANQNEKNAERAFNLQKGLAIVETLINTSVAIMKVARDTKDPIGPLRLANMIAMGVAGAAQVAAIASRKFNPSGATGGGSVPTTSGGASTAPTQPPSFNVVGQSGFNQVAGALGQQPPVQAFVVAGDVTTAQQLQNNTITQATF